MWQRANLFGERAIRGGTFVSRCTFKRHGRTARVGVLSLAMATSASAATTSNWLTATSGNWTDPTKWSTNPNYPNNGAPPGTAYDAVVAATGAAYTVALDSTVTIDHLTVNSVDATMNLALGGAI